MSRSDSNIKPESKYEFRVRKVSLATEGYLRQTARANLVALTLPLRLTLASLPGNKTLPGSLLVLQCQWSHWQAPDATASGSAEEPEVTDPIRLRLALPVAPPGPGPAGPAPPQAFAAYHHSASLPRAVGFHEKKSRVTSLS